MSARVRLAVLVASMSLMAARPVSAAALSLWFPDLKPGGQVVVALFDTEKTWKAADGAVRSAKAPVGADPVTVRLDAPPGRYAVMAYHDLDGDGRLDTLPVGLPTEPYGFSNNARGTFGPPRWSAAAFTLTAAGAAQPITLR